MNAQFEGFPSERRRSPRIDGTGIKVEYSSGKDKDTTTKSTVKNICIQGICIYMPEVVEVTETIDMKIFLPNDDTPIPTKGSIVWYTGGGKADSYCAGIEFQGMSAEDQKKLSDFSEKRFDEEPPE